MGAQFKILSEATKFSTHDAIRSKQLQIILAREGGIFDQDATKVVNYLDIDGQVSLHKLDTVFARAK